MAGACAQVQLDAARQYNPSKTHIFFGGIWSVNIQSILKCLLLAVTFCFVFVSSSSARIDEDSTDKADKPSHPFTVTYAPDEARPDLPIRRLTKKSMARAQYFVRKRKNKKAIRVITKALKRDINNRHEQAELLSVLARYQMRAKDRGAAIEAYEKILKFKDSIPHIVEQQALSELAKIHYGAANYDSALAYLELIFDRVLTINPSHHMLAAQIYYQFGDYQKAIFYYKKTIDEAIYTPRIWHLLGIAAYWRTLNYPDMRTVAEASLKRWPKYSKRWCGLLASASSAENSTDSDTAVANTVQAYPACSKLEKPVQPDKVQFKYASFPLINTHWRSKNRKVSGGEHGWAIRTKKGEEIEKQLAENLHGYVTLEYTVNADGSVKTDDVIVLRSVPQGYFVEDALKTLATHKYEPLIVDGKAQETIGVRRNFVFYIKSTRKKHPRAKDTCLTMLNCGVG
ncbi:MAG: hypothetical protein COB37_02785 [Kordiimonadales bacterium]|nr:MAG: hypothetical protein COB37_02785 [Kordiimonadales bacterium]